VSPLETIGQFSNDLDEFMKTSQYESTTWGRFEMSPQNFENFKSKIFVIKIQTH